FERAGHFVQFGGDPVELVDLHFGEQARARMAPVLGDLGRDARQRGFGETFRLFQFVDHAEEHVELTHRSKPYRDLSQPAAELGRDIRVQLEYRKHFPQTPRGDAGAMQRAHVALWNPLQHPRKPLEARAKQVVRFYGTGHDSRMAETLIIAEPVLPTLFVPEPTS